MTGVFLQVRLDSSRLPNKALLELGGRAVIDHAMHALARVPASVHALLTDETSARLLKPRAERYGYEVFVGPKENVLERYVLAARRYGVRVVVRATGDNPLVSWELARLAVALFARERADYCGFDGPPLGCGVEILRVDALERAVRESTSTYDREHVSPYLYHNPDDFRIVRVPAPTAYHLPKARVTLDTADDYAALDAVFRELYDGGPVPVLQLVRHLRETASRRAQPAGETDAYSSGA